MSTFRSPESPHSVQDYARVALPNLENLVRTNTEVMERLASRLVADVKAGRSLLVFGSGHSAIFSLELYHRAGGPSFVVPIFADYLFPSTGPRVVRFLERNPHSAAVLLDRVEPRPGEMIWLSSQSGINPAIVELAIQAKGRGLVPVAFTSRIHSDHVPSRHSSGKKLYEVCDEVVDLGGRVGDAAVAIAPDLAAGPLSTLGGVLAAHSIVVAACARLEQEGIRCVYTSVNTAEGEKRNVALEDAAKKRDPLLR